MGEDDKQKKHQLESLNQQLEKVKKFEPRTVPATRGTSDGAKAAIDFGSAVAVGTLLGYGVDQWQQTAPWGMLVGLLIGTASGVKLMFQVEANRQKRDNDEEQDR